MSLPEVQLDTPHGCREELQKCANGMAGLIHRHTELRLELVDLDQEVEIAEALITVDLAANAPRMTATDRKAHVLVEIDKVPAGMARRRRAEVVAKLDVLERRFRTYEKRMSAAQSALNDHQAEARSAGLAGR